MKYLTISGVIKTEPMMNLIMSLIEANNENEDVTLTISSGGGEVWSMSMVVETMKDLKISITTIGMGLVASCAAKIFLMGNKRIIVPNTEFVLHYSRISDFRDSAFTADKQKIVIEDTAKADKVFLEPLFTRSKVTSKLLSKKCNNAYGNWTLTPEEIERYDIAKIAEPGWTRMLAGLKK